MGKLILPLSTAEHFSGNIKMDKIIKSKNELILGVVGIFLLAVLTTVFAWGIGFLGLNIGKAINSSKSTNSSVSFDLKGAEQLNLKGLGQQ